jgi:hypothetical protein
MYLAVNSGKSLSFGNIQSIAQKRWSWLVENWSVYSEAFKTATNGNGNLVEKYNILKTFIDSYKLGNTNNPLDTLENFVTVLPFMNLILLSNITLTPEELSFRDKEAYRVQNLQPDDFENMVTFLRRQAAYQAQRIGLGDPDASTLLGIQTQEKQKNATIADLEQIENINNLRRVAEKLLFGSKAQQKRPPNLLAISNAMVDPLTPVVFSNDYLTQRPVPFEISLEHMAQKYLGRRDRWYDLVSVNYLKPPYVDSVGVKLPLIAPPASNNLIISADQKNNLYVGAKVSIGSYRYPEETRAIERLIVNENNTMVLFLSGDQNISKYKPTEGGFVRVYAPNTVRSGSFVVIPSTTASGINSSAPTPSSDLIGRLDQALVQFGVDIAKDPVTNDFNFDSNGNFKKAVGLVNVRQTVLSTLKTKKGELPFHTGYGVDINIGSRFYGTTDEAVIFAQLLQTTLLGDPRFDSVQISKLSVTGTGIALTILVTLAGSNVPIPLSFIS